MNLIHHLLLVSFSWDIPVNIVRRESMRIKMFLHLSKFNVFFIYIYSIYAIVANRTERILERNQEKFSNLIHSVKSFAQNIFNVG